MPSSMSGWNNSRHTVRSYRDTWRLFLRFMAAQQQRPVAALRLTDLTASEVLALLDHSEKERSVSIGTRNCRLAALRSFFCFVADREPLAAGQCAEVLRIPIKRGPRRLICYLESAEVTAILAEPDRKTLDGQRDHALLALLYNTGARIQEALDFGFAFTGTLFEAVFLSIFATVIDRSRVSSLDSAFRKRFLSIPGEWINCAQGCSL
jgi:site-specific recombinase XerD